MKLKKILYLLVLFTLVLQSCNPDDFLGIKPRGKDIPREYKHYDGLMTAFEMIRWQLAGNRLFFPLMSDEYTVTETSMQRLVTQAYTQGKECFVYNPDFLLEDDIPYDWGYNANMYAYNLIINNVMGCTDASEAQKLSTQSEARVNRAWILFRMAQIYLKPYNESYAADTPALPIISESSTMTEVFERVSMKELFNFIVKEMEESCPNIQNATAFRFRTEKGDAYTMLGKVYHYMGNYKKALECLRLAKQYVEENGSAIITDLNTVADNKVMADGVLHMNEPQNMRNIWCPNYAIVTYSATSVPSLLVKDKYFNLFSEGDRRALRFPLYENNRRACDTDTPMGVCSYNLYIVLAECEAREGSLANAKAALEHLRQYRLTPDYVAVPADVDTKEEYIKFAVEEWIRENLGNGKFYFEMKRLWNDPQFQYLKAEYQHEVLGTEQVYPFTEAQLEMKIPTSVLKWNTNWVVK